MKGGVIVVTDQQQLNNNSDNNEPNKEKRKVECTINTASNERNDIIRREIAKFVEVEVQTSANKEANQYKMITKEQYY